MADAFPLVPVESLTQRRGQHFYCAEYRARLSAAACLARQDAGPAKRSGLVGASVDAPYPKCVECTVGDRVAAITRGLPDEPPRPVAAPVEPPPRVMPRKSRAELIEHNGEKLTRAEWAERCGVTQAGLAYRAKFLGSWSAAITAGRSRRGPTTAAR